MAKKSKKSSKMHKSFPAQGNPMDVADHPVNSIPTPQGGAFGGTPMPGAPMLPGQPMQ